MRKRAYGVVLVVLVLALLLPTAIGRAETEQILPIELSGEIDGAAYKIHVPKKWNGTLLVYAHGYPQFPVPDPDIAFPDEEMAALLLEKGYALAASGFRGAGMNIWEGMEDSEALVRYFETEVAAPDRVILYGISMGGMVALKSIEVYPDRYDGIIPLCTGASMTMHMDKRLDYAIAYDAAFGWPDTWGEVGDVRDDIEFYSEVWFPKISGEILNPDGTFNTDNYAKWEFVRRVTGTSLGGYYAYQGPVDMPPGVVALSYFITGQQAELEVRAGGPYRQNTGRVYGLDARDARDLAAMGLDTEPLLAAMNAQTDIVADPDARAFVANIGDYTRVITTPVLMAHNMEDAILGVENTLRYQEVLAAAGTEQWLVRVYSDLPGHCHFTNEQILTLFETMDTWLDTGVQPNPLKLPGFVPFHVTHLPLAVRGE